MTALQVLSTPGGSLGRGIGPHRDSTFSEVKLHQVFFALGVGEYESIFLLNTNGHFKGFEMVNEK